MSYCQGFAAQVLYTNEAQYATKICRNSSHATVLREPSSRHQLLLCLVGSCQQNEPGTHWAVGYLRDWTSGLAFLDTDRIHEWRSTEPRTSSVRKFSKKQNKKNQLGNDPSIIRYIQHWTYEYVSSSSRLPSSSTSDASLIHSPIPCFSAYPKAHPSLSLYPKAHPSLSYLYHAMLEWSGVQLRGLLTFSWQYGILDAELAEWLRDTPSIHFW